MILDRWDECGLRLQITYDRGLQLGLQRDWHGTYRAWLFFISSSFAWLTPRPMARRTCVSVFNVRCTILRVGDSLLASWSVRSYGHTHLRVFRSRSLRVICSCTNQLYYYITIYLYHYISICLYVYIIIYFTNTRSPVGPCTDYYYLLINPW